MRGRFYYADGRTEVDVMLDERATRHALADGDRLRWFVKTDRVDPDGFTVLTEVARRSDGHDTPTE